MASAFAVPGQAPVIRTKEPPMLHPGASTSQLKLAAQAQFDPSASENPPYVLHVVPLGPQGSQGYLFAGSDDSLRVFSPTLELVGELKSSQKGKGITSVVKGAGEDSNAVFVTARDGTLVGWDTRDWSKEAFKVKGKSGAPYLICSQSSDLNCVAVGTELHHYEATIDFWDLRTLTLSHTYTEAHSDDLTALSFHPSPSLSHVLLSASVDGLINTYDARIADEDDAVLTTQQVNASLMAAGWLSLPGQPGEMRGVWGATTVETVQIWDADESELIEDLGDIREVALQPWRSDYLIGTHYNSALGGLCFMAGTQKGDVAIINARDPKNWVLEQVLPGVGGRTLGGRGHADIVRCACLDSKTSTVATGGEDGRICLWSL
ncbi:WD repeat domain 89 [Pseudohyphozyma bogoriensis]|nr:WD repeat domain 89 [Pseudohyphozyma bogoriensis]